MGDAGLAAGTDAVGNVRGRAGPAAGPATPPALLLGSHYDTVTDAGAYDGTLGLVAALAAVKAVAAATPGGVKAFTAPVEVVAFSDEEGVRFGTTFLGSAALAGRLEGSGALDVEDAGGVTVREALADAGLATGADDIVATALDPRQYVG